MTVPIRLIVNYFIQDVKYVPVFSESLGFTIANSRLFRDTQHSDPQNKVGTAIHKTSSSLCSCL
jgi:hypothetical protein